MCLPLCRRGRAIGNDVKAAFVTARIGTSAIPYGRNRE